jgi:hypothetical protein
VSPISIRGDVGTELWVDPQTRPDFAAWEALARQRGDDADASRLGYIMNRTLLQDVLFGAGGVEAEFPLVGTSCSIDREHRAVTIFDPATWATISPG